MSGKLSAFPWVGGKYYYADWIIGHFPDHRLYVEPFGGAAHVLIQKPESHTEVYNDLNSDLVHFYRVVKSRSEELREWLEAQPYSRELHEEWGREFFDGHRPGDEIERAGRWFYLRYTQYGAKISGFSGFKTPKVRNEAQTFRRAIDRLPLIAERIDAVTLECRDWEDVLARYDRADALFYLDPPYVDCEAYYGDADFDHARLAAALEETEARWLLSYQELPESIDVDRYTVRELSATTSLDVVEGEQRDRVTERLVMNFDPTGVPTFTGPQRDLGSFGGNQ